MSPRSPSVTDPLPPRLTADLDRLRTGLDATIPPRRARHNILVATWNLREFGDLTEKWRSRAGDEPLRDLAKTYVYGGKPFSAHSRLPALRAQRETARARRPRPLRRGLPLRAGGVIEPIPTHDGALPHGVLRRPQLRPLLPRQDVHDGAAQGPPRPPLPAAARLALHLGHPLSHRGYCRRGTRHFGWHPAD